MEMVGVMTFWAAVNALATWYICQYFYRKMLSMMSLYEMQRLTPGREQAMRQAYEPLRAEGALALQHDGTGKLRKEPLEPMSEEYRAIYDSVRGKC